MEDNNAKDEDAGKASEGELQGSDNCADGSSEASEEQPKQKKLKRTPTKKDKYLQDDSPSRMSKRQRELRDEKA